mmetsp:Transcript_23138/g.60463  ORF Transcript_23138/g.60463 Transcript_23138/m.60463 type:complete len:414 (-) Transcript_23138:179-1420(-)
MVGARIMVGTTAAVYMCAFAGSVAVAAHPAHAQASEGTCAITDHGASVGAADNAAAINAAISACSGGGTVVVAGGSYNTGPLVVSTSGITIEVESGSALVAAFGPDNWPKDGSGGYQDFLVFNNCNGCGIVGGGVLFGKGGRPPFGFDWYYLFDQKKISSRPDFVVVNGGSAFTMTGVTLLDAPAFNVALHGVNGVEIGGINITSRWYVDPKTDKLMEPHNTDGIDPMDGTSNVHIHDVYIHNGDDSVAVKPGPMGTCTQNILVENCHFEKGHGCSIGSVGAGCVQNVVFRNINIEDQENGCRVKTYSDSPGFVKNITWQDITIKNTGSCISVNANYRPPPPNPTNFIAVSELLFEKIDGSGCGSGPQFVCPDQSPCRDISLHDVHLDGGKMDCEHAYGKADDVDPDSCLKSE